MSKLYFIELAEFNQRTTEIVCSWLDRLSDEQWQHPVVSSFNSIAETTIHIIGAQNAWVERLLRKEPVTNLQKEFRGTKEELLDFWKKSSASFKEFVAGFEETRLTETFSFRRFNGEQYALAYYQVIAHVVNHGAYHRGQLVTMLRQVGYTDVSSTDLSGFYDGS